jgi:tetratricopeptide (TPR) repeat protein
MQSENTDGTIPSESSSPEQEALEAEIKRRIEQGLCFECGQPEAKLSSFMRVMSFVLITRHKEWKAFLCPSCTARTGSRELAISCVLGWWGIPWGILTLKAIALNTWSLLRSNLAGRFAAVVIVGGLVMAVTLIVNASVRKSAEREAAKEAGNVVSRSVHFAYEEAMMLCDQGKFAEALEPLMRARAGAPRSSAINHLLGVVHVNLGDFTQAMKYLEQAHDAEPGNDMTTCQLATVCSTSGEPEKAYRLLGEVIARTEMPVEVHKDYQGAGFSTGKGQALRAWYRKRLREQVGSADAHYLYGQTLREPKEQATAMRQALTLEPDHGPARCALIRALLSLRDYKAAEAECAKLPPPRPEGSERAIEGALVAFESGRVEEALKRISAGIAEGCDSPETRYIRALILIAAGRYEKALDDLAHIEEQCTPGSPNAGFVMLAKIACLLEQGDPDRATEVLEKERAAPPAPTRFHRLCTGLAEGAIKWQLGDLEGAVAAYASCPDLDGAPASSVKARLHEGILLALLGKREEARRTWRTLADSDHPGRRFNSRRLAAKMLLGETSPSDYLHAGRRVSRLHDNDARFYVGVFHELAGRKSEAREAYQACLDRTLGEDFPVKQARHALKRLE